ncbi:hypothetical protein CC2G_007496 [Coprinopsis cinerea AmutBmut pab1-1]|nr:hypothetical protein CC2G_007496 [Coprinopsis cinerea AmutBmut pab1-1]
MTVTRVSRRPQSKTWLMSRDTSTASPSTHSPLRQVRRTNSGDHFHVTLARRARALEIRSKIAGCKSMRMHGSPRAASVSQHSRCFTMIIASHSREKRPGSGHLLVGNHPGSMSSSISTATFLSSSKRPLHIAHSSALRHHPEISCDRLLSLQWFLTYTIHGLAAVFSVLRMYGLYNRNRRVLVALCTITALLVTGAAIILFLDQEGLRYTPPTRSEKVDNCHARMKTKRALRYVSQYVCVFCLDLIVFIMTLRKSLQNARIWRSTPLFKIVIRDGTLSFGVMSMSCLAVIFCFVFNAPETRGREVILITSISSILVSRIILNLRDPMLCRPSGEFTNYGEINMTSNIYTNYTDEQDTIYLESTSLPYHRHCP